MSIFKNWYKDYKELEEEVKFYSRENFLKEERYRKLNKEYKEILRQNEELKERLEVLENARKTTGRKHNTRNKSTSKRISK